MSTPPLFEKLACVSTFFSLLFLLLPTSFAGTQCGATMDQSSVLGAGFVGDGYDEINPTIMTDGGSTWIAMWEHQEVSKPYQLTQYSYVLVKRSTDNGVNWSAPAWISCATPACFYYANNPVLASDGKGGWIAAWTEFHSDNNVNRGRDVVIARSTNNGASWGAPSIVNSAPVIPDASYDVSDIAYGANVWIVTGTRLHAGRQRVFYFRSTDRGVNWSGPFYPDLATNLDATSPKITSNGKSAWVLAWFTYNSASAFSEDGVRTARSIDNGVSWQSSAIDGFVQRSLIEVDDVAYSAPNNLWTIIWSSDVNLKNPSGGDLSQNNIIQAVSTNNGGVWSDAAWLIGDENDTLSDGQGSLSLDAQGNMALNWIRQDPSTGSPFWINQRCRKTGSLNVWSDVKDLNQDISGSTVRIESVPSIATNRAGRLIAAWEAKRNPNGTVSSESSIFISLTLIPARDPLRLCLPCVMPLLE